MFVCLICLGGLSVLPEGWRECFVTSRPKTASKNTERDNKKHDMDPPAIK